MDGKARIPASYVVYGVGPEPSAEPELSEVERLMREFEVHEGTEADFLRRYRELAARAGSPLVKFLLTLIIADEEKHRSVIHDVASALSADLTWTKTEHVFSGLYHLGDDREELIRLTEGFMGLEKRGIRELRRLMKESKGYYRGLFSLLLQTMIDDSEKHIRILDFLRRRLKEA